MRPGSECVFNYILTSKRPSSANRSGTLLKLKRMKPGDSILLLKLTKLTNLTKPKLYEKKCNANVSLKELPTKYFKLMNCKVTEKMC